MPACLPSCHMNHPLASHRKKWTQHCAPKHWWTRFLTSFSSRIHVARVYQISTTIRTLSDVTPSGKRKSDHENRNKNLSLAINMSETSAAIITWKILRHFLPATVLHLSSQRPQIPWQCERSPSRPLNISSKNPTKYQETSLYRANVNKKMWKTCTVDYSSNDYERRRTKK